MPRASAHAPLVALLTDYGSADSFVAVVKLVILGIAPGVPLVDVTHDVAPQDVRGGAWIVHTTWRELPLGSILLAVVDPGVGTARRAVAFAAGGRLFVGPDNGIFGPLLHASPATEAVLLDNPHYQRPDPSSTFHGRDLFGPAAGHLAAGIALASLGCAIDPASLDAQPLPQPEPHALGLRGQVLHVDRFGNLILSFGPDIAPTLLRQPQLCLRVGGVEIRAQAATFARGPLGVPFAYSDSSGYLGISMRNDSAARHLRVGRDAEVLAVGAVDTAAE